jgi:hypothetical protein
MEAPGSIPEPSHWGDPQISAPCWPILFLMALELTIGYCFATRNHATCQPTVACIEGTPTLPILEH